MLTGIDIKKYITFDFWKNFLRVSSIFFVSAILTGCDFNASVVETQQVEVPPALDRVAPSISFVSPEDNDTITNRRPVISINYSDNEVVNTNSLNVLVNFETVIRTCVINITAAECTPDEDLPLGDVTITASVSDNSGNASAVSISIVVEEALDTTSPEIIISSPVDGSTTTDRRPEVSINFSDDTGLDMSTLEVSLSGADITSVCNVSDDVASCKPTTDIPFGEVDVVASISDEAGNLGSDTISFTVEELPDATSPTISIDQPISGVALTNRRPLIGVSFDDDRGVVVSSFSLLVAGQDLTSICTVSNGSASCQPESDLPLGPFAINASISDEAGNESTDVVNITLITPPDLTPPVVSIVSPLDGASVQNRRPEISVTYFDNAAVNLSSFRLEIAGQDVTSVCDVGNTGAVCQPVSDVPLGASVIMATVSDVSGNAASETVTVNIQDPPDTVSPTITIDSPADGATITDKTPTVSVSYNDDRALDISSLKVVVAGDDISANCTATDSSATCPIGSDLALGLVKIDASISDESGNSGNASVTITVEDPPDIVSPTITIDSPADGATITDMTPTVSVSYSDDRALDISSLKVVVAGDDISANCTVTDSLATCPVSTGLALGSVKIDASISDEAGNSGNASVTITLEDPPDTVSPTITIDSPADGATITDMIPTVTVSYGDDRAVDVSSLKVVVAGGDISANCTATDSSAMCPVSSALALGSVKIDASISDEAGNSGDASVTITVENPPDTVSPTITIDSPADGATITDKTPTVTVSYSDDRGLDTDSLIVIVAGTDVSSACAVTATSAECPTTDVLPSGSFTIEASISDVAGNSSSSSTSVTVGSVPKVTIGSPQSGLLTKTDSTSVSGTISELAEKVTVNGVEATLNGVSFAATVPLREGENMVTATATLSSGLTASDSIEIVRDVFAPLVSISTPSEGFVSVDDEIAIAGLVNDIVSGGIEAVVTVNGKAATVSNGSFVFTGLKLVNGPNTINVKATDAAGNTSSTSVTVTRRTPAGTRITLSSGDGQSDQILTKLSDPLRVQVVDNSGNPVTGKIVRFSVTRNNGLLFPVETAASISPKSETGKYINRILGPNNSLTKGDVAAGARTFSVATDGNGFASVTMRLGNVVGSGNNRVVASVLGVAGEVEFCHTAKSAPAERVIGASGLTQRGSVGQPLPEPMEALVTDVEGNPIEGVEVTFKVAKGDGTIDGVREVKRTSDALGMTRAVLTLGLTSGISVSQVTATAEGVMSGPASFTASAFETGAIENTTFTGVVLDNALTPIPGAKIHIPVEGGDDIEGVTDAQGQFELSNVPVGFIHLEIDPTESPRSENFPPLEFETTTVAGIANQLGQPILIPPTDMDSSQLVGGDQDVTLKMSDVPGMSITVFANSATFPTGASTGQMSISQVAGDKVPMPPPDGIIFTPPVWTFQPAGVSFNPPARIQMPNSDGLAPGTIINMFQFDHTIFEFINVGKGTVSEDGLTITSDIGFGISRSGWGGGGPPPPPPNCAGSCGTGGNSCSTGMLVRSDSGTCQCVFSNAPVGTVCESDNVCTVGSKTCNANGSCDAAPAPDNTSCDDGLFCTSSNKEVGGADVCEGGRCQIEKVSDKNVITTSVDLEDILGTDFDFIDTIFDVIFDELDTEGDQNSVKSEPEFDIESALSKKVADVCCEGTRNFEPMETLSGTVNLTYAGSYTTPVVRTPQGFKFSGTFGANVTLAANASSSVDQCSDPSGCSSEFSGALSGGLSGNLNAAFIDESILNIMPTINAGGLSGTYTYACGDSKFDVCVGPVEAVLSVEILSLFNFATDSYEIIEKACF